jgi:hypothetical protein
MAAYIFMGGAGRDSFKPVGVEMSYHLGSSVGLCCSCASVDRQAIWQIQIFQEGGQTPDAAAFSGYRIRFSI